MPLNEVYQILIFTENNLCVANQTSDDPAFVSDGYGREWDDMRITHTEQSK